MKRRKIQKKLKRQYLRELELFEIDPLTRPAPVAPRGHLYECPFCAGRGILPANNFPKPDTRNYPKIAIIGAGIGGTAFAVACLHRGIPFTLFERDFSFSDRSQGYGLTLQQASRAIHALGIESLRDGIVSTRHLVHDENGEVMGEWGLRKWLESNTKKENRRTNVHIARQSLRKALFEQLPDNDTIHWGYRLDKLSSSDDGKIALQFKIGEEKRYFEADLVVGADGIRSVVRNEVLGEERSPLQYLGCIVILGICAMSSLEEHHLLDHATVFQTANGQERIYVMPYDDEHIMWQLSYKMDEEKAEQLSDLGPEALKKEASLRTQWHDPIPDIIKSTPTQTISGYPVYDRELLHPDFFTDKGNITLLGDAAHPMSPFKGQGANQALLDALELARNIADAYDPYKEKPKLSIREAVLNNFEIKMCKRTAPKVLGSAVAAKILHTKNVLIKANEPRGRHLR